ncbi:MAG: DUF2304 domain-containing protein [Lachnospiraceae bacterium]|nr:DUF2304 domain-containing protein [Lachnospiraceae bacterium]
MSVALRVVLIVVSALTFLAVAHRIRRSAMRIEDSIFWIGFVFLLLLFAIFPGIVYTLSGFAGTMAPSNFIFLFVIFVLLVKIFSMSLQLSVLESKLKDLAQEMALRQCDVPEASQERSAVAGLHGVHDTGEDMREDRK